MDMKVVSFGKRLYVIKHFILFSEITKTKKQINGIKDIVNKFCIFILWIPGKLKSRNYIKNLKSKDKKV